MPPPGIISAPEYHEPDYARAIREQEAHARTLSASALQHEYHVLTLTQRVVRTDNGKILTAIAGPRHISTLPVLAGTPHQIKEKLKKHIDEKIDEWLALPDPMEPTEEEDDLTAQNLLETREAVYENGKNLRIVPHSKHPDRDKCDGSEEDNTPDIRGCDDDSFLVD